MNISQEEQERLNLEFRDAVLSLSRRMDAEVNHYPRLLLALVGELGPQEAVQRLIVNGPTTTFDDLHLVRRSDLSVEVLALDPRWQTLFDTSVLDAARQRLELYQISVP
jgi:hypothetical protein